MAKKVLIVDDDPTLLGVVGEHVSIAGYDTRSTTDGAIAIRLADEWKPDLILLDIMMPEIDGFMVAKRVREFSTVPIIILSSKGKEADILRAFEEGVDDYIVKPFSPVELLARIRAVFRRSEDAEIGIPQAKFQHGDLTIDTEAARVLKSGREIEVSVLQFKLLMTLAVHMGQVVSSDELLVSIWGAKHTGAKSKLWLILNRLKQKIEDDPRKPTHIVTVPRIGYVMPKDSSGSSKEKGPRQKVDASVQTDDGSNAE